MNCKISRNSLLFTIFIVSRSLQTVHIYSQSKHRNCKGFSQRFSSNPNSRRPKSFEETKSHECANYRGIGNMQIGFKIREVGGVSDYVRIGGKQSLSLFRSISFSFSLCVSTGLSREQISLRTEIFSRAEPNRACFRLLLSSSVPYVYVRRCEIEGDDKSRRDYMNRIAAGNEN